jgi:hypothetical protein
VSTVYIVFSVCVKWFVSCTRGFVVPGERERYPGMYFRVTTPRKGTFVYEGARGLRNLGPGFGFRGELRRGGVM